MRLRVSIKLAAAVMLLVLTIGGAIVLALNALSVERSRLEYLLGRRCSRPRLRPRRCSRSRTSRSPSRQ